MAVGFKKWVIGKALKEGPKVIKSIKANVPKTNIEKAQRTLDVEGQKVKARMAKIQSDIFHGAQDIKKSLGKMKKPKSDK